MASCSNEDFRKAVGCFATGVVVVTTTGHHGEPIGITVSSLASVSLEPPLILFCLDNNALSRQFFTSERLFRVNILNAAQTEVAGRFAKRGGPKFQTDAKFPPDQPPTLDNVHASMLCKLHSTHGAGDHVVIFGEVFATDVAEVEPLLYHRGRFGHWSPIEYISAGE